MHVQVQDSETTESATKLKYPLLVTFIIHNNNVTVLLSISRSSSLNVNPHVDALACSVLLAAFSLFLILLQCLKATHSALSADASVSFLCLPQMSHFLF